MQDNFSPLQENRRFLPSSASDRDALSWPWQELDTLKHLTFLGHGLTPLASWWLDGATQTAYLLRNEHQETNLTLCVLPLRFSEGETPPYAHILRHVLHWEAHHDFL